MEVLSLEGTVVTIDAMGCQSEVAKEITNRKADYILAVIENQQQLHEDIEDEFRFGKQMEKHLCEDLGHGRIETRVCQVISNFQFIGAGTFQKWKGLKAVIKIESVREFKNSDRTKETAIRYYITSLEGSAEDFQKAVHSHWGMENKLHWTLDVAFGEDLSRKRNNNASQNFSILNKIALNLL